MKGQLLARKGGTCGASSGQVIAAALHTAIGNGAPSDASPGIQRPSRGTPQCIGLGSLGTGFVVVVIGRGRAIDALALSDAGQTSRNVVSISGRHSALICCTLLAVVGSVHDRATAAVGVADIGHVVQCIVGKRGGAAINGYAGVIAIGVIGQSRSATRCIHFRSLSSSRIKFHVGGMAETISSCGDLTSSIVDCRRNTAVWIGGFDLTIECVKVHAGNAPRPVRGGRYVSFCVVAGGFTAAIRVLGAYESCGGVIGIRRRSSQRIR